MAARRSAARPKSDQRTLSATRHRSEAKQSKGSGTALDCFVAALLATTIMLSYPTSRRTLVTSLPASRMRAMASAIGSIDDGHVEGVGVQEIFRRRARWRRGLSRTRDRRAAGRRRLPSPRPAHRAPVPACRCRADKQCRRPIARLAPAPSSRARARSCRPTDKARRESVPPRRRNPSRMCRWAQDASPAHSRRRNVTAMRSLTCAIARRAPSGSASIGGCLIAGAENTKVRSATTLCVAAAPGVASALAGSQPT